MIASCDDVHIFASHTSKYQNSSLALSSVGSQVFSGPPGVHCGRAGQVCPQAALPTHLSSPEAKSECEVLGHPHVSDPLRAVGSSESICFLNVLKWTDIPFKINTPMLQNIYSPSMFKDLWCSLTERHASCWWNTKRMRKPSSLL